MLTMNVRVEGLPQTKEKLRKVNKVLSNMKPGFDSVGDYLLKFFTVNVFESEGAVYGRKWTPLNPVYAAWKSTAYPGRGILERSGKMRQGFKATSTKDFLLIRNGTKYLQKHQKGDGVPQRVIVDLTHEMKRTIERLLTDDVMTRLRRSI